MHPTAQRVRYSNGHILVRDGGRLRLMETIGRVLLDATGTMIEVDRVFAEMLRSSPEKLIGTNALDTTAPADRERCKVLLDGLFVDRQPVSTVKRLIRADGSHIWVNNALMYVADADGRPGCVFTSRPVDLPDNWVEPNKLLRIAKFIEHSRRARALMFNRQLFTDPAWDIILLAYIHEAEGDVIDTHKLCDTVGISPASASRWLRALMTEQLIECETEVAPEAPITCPFHLTSAAHERIERYLSDLYNTLTPADRMNMPA